MAQIYERNVGAEDGLRDKEAYRDQSITKSRVRAWLYMGVNHPPGRVPPKVKRFLKYRSARQLRDNADRDSCPILLKRAHKIL